MLRSRAFPDSFREGLSGLSPVAFTERSPTSSQRVHQHLDKNPANYQPLTPLTFLERAAAVSPEHSAVIHGSQRFTYAEFYARARRLASALARAGIGPGDTVSVMLANTPPMLEAHYGVPMTGAVLHSINTRLDAGDHRLPARPRRTKVLITDREFARRHRQALAQAKVKPLVIDYDDTEFPQAGEPLSGTDYEAFLARGDPGFRWRMPERRVGGDRAQLHLRHHRQPQGRGLHHRGAALMCYANMVAAGMGKHPVYLWTLPMFHCNGWCFPWTVVGRGRHARVPPVGAGQGDVRCHRRAQGDAPVRRADRHVDAAQRQGARRSGRCRTRCEFVTAAAPPPEAVLAAMAEAGFNVTHVYGLTEIYGPAVVNEWHADGTRSTATSRRRSRRARACAIPRSRT